MPPDSTDVAVSEAIFDWYNAWENGDDLSPATLRPDWQPCQWATLEEELKRRKELLRRCDQFELLLQTSAPQIVQRTIEVPDIPGYKNLRLIGKGGQGVVYQAEDSTVLQRHVVIKLMKQDAFVSDKARKRFVREAQTLSDLHHRNIVEIFHAGYLKDQPYLVLEYCPGSLRQRVGEQGTLLPEHAAEQVMILASTIEVAHRKGCIHRDLKPDNVLLDADGTLKISDFGLAQRQDDPGLTRSGQRFGTPGYWAPEQALGDSNATGVHTDIFGLGAILYRLLTGSAPVPDVSDAELLQAFDSIKPPRQSRSEIPRDLEVICHKCLQRNPADRYATAGALADDLNRYLSGETIVAREVTTLERFLRTLVLRRLDARFRDWGNLAFGAAAGMFTCSVLTAFWPLAGSIVFYGGMALLLFRCFNRPSSAELQLGMLLFFNLLACVGMNLVIYRTVFPQVGTNVWAPAAIINSMTLTSAGIIFDRRFLLYAIFFFFVGTGISYLLFPWSCLMYGLAWILILVPMGLYFRRLDRPR